MNKVKNWSILSAIVFAAALACIGTPYVALTLGAFGIFAAYAALVRYEDHVGYIGSMSNSK